MNDSAGSFIFKDDLLIESNLDNENENTLSVLLDKTREEILTIKKEILSLSERLTERKKIEASIIERLEEYISPKVEIKLESPTITEANTTTEQIEFMFNLFHGRRDAFAVRKIRKDAKTKTERVSYYTACDNYNMPGCIYKLPEEEREGKGCKECQIRSLTTLTPEIYNKHNIRNHNEKGIGAVGIYAVLPGNMCRFLAIDLDEKTWKHDALEIADVARRDGFQMAIECSFSGNGAHLWLFFKEEVPASKARELAFSFIDKACEKSKTVSLKSYDRIFPTQDTVSNNGFGNLILMPIVCSAALREENPGTVFVDNNFIKYPKQIPFLSSLPRYSREDVELYLMSPKASSASTFELSPFSDDETDILWRNRLPEISQKDSLVDILPIYQSSGLSIPKDALNAKLQNALKRLACFSNPEYFITKNRNNGYIPDGTSMFIETFIESEDVLQLPRGLKGGLEKYLSQSGIAFKIYDKRVSNTGLNALFKGELRKEQMGAYTALMSHEIGILQAATSFGKTVIAARLIAERKEKTLILVQSKTLLEQWKNGLEQFLEVNNSPIKRDRKRINKTGIGIYGNASDSLSSFVDIAMIQTISKRMPDFIRNYGMVIIDECHHLAADTFIKVMHAIRPRYVYGLSATVERKDRMERLVYAQCGPVIYKYKADRLAYNRGITQYFIPRFTRSTCRASISKNNTECQKDIALDPERNDLIASDIAKLFEEGKRILVLTSLISHIGEIEKRLKEKNIPSIVTHGSLPTIEKREALNRIKNENNKAVIISTGKFLGEGVDIPYLDTLIVAAPISWKGVVSQYVGRIAREYKGKNKIQIYDYVDIFIPLFVAMYNKRLKTYKELGYIITSPIGDSTAINFPRSFYSQDDIYPVIRALISNVRKEIVISSPYLKPGAGALKIIEELHNASNLGVSVEVRVSLNNSQEEINRLIKAGIHVVVTSSCYLKFASFDRKSLLFGELNLLGNYINIREGRLPLDTESSAPHVMILVNDPDVINSLLEPNLFL